MKKLLITLTSLLLVFGLTACTSSDTTDENTLKVSATLDPHSKILEFVKPILKENYDIDLEIIVLDDYFVFNQALNDGEVDANYFQHEPFFNAEVSEKGYDISNIAGIHIEPFGFYSQNITSLNELVDGDEIIISNSISDHGRILSILDKAGVITLDPTVDVLSATAENIIENSKNLKFIEVKPEILVATYENGEGALVAINGNYAIQAGLNPLTDTVLLEQADSTNPYVNIVACQTGKENDAKIKALVEVLKSDEVKQFILDTYADGSVISAE
jgi:D-methionine transport system substrate-binding protein